MINKSRAESVFEAYLQQRHLPWEHEALSGRKKPDYVLNHPTGKCIVEVKQIESPNPLPKDGFDPDRPVRSKIRSARKQLGEYKDYCCSLALFTESMFGPSEPSTILAAAFGPGYQQAGRDYSRVDPTPPYYRFLKKSEMAPDMQFLTNALLSPAANRTFSSLILLGHYELNELQLEVWRRLYIRQEAGHEIEHTDQFRLLEELGPSLGASRRYTETVRVIVIENRHARIPFPDDLFRGPFDQRWGWKDEWCGPVWVGSTLESLYSDGVPFHML
jgi:hypothetical protein